MDVAFTKLMRFKWQILGIAFLAGQFFSACGGAEDEDNLRKLGNSNGDALLGDYQKAVALVPDLIQSLDLPDELASECQNGQVNTSVLSPSSSDIQISEGSSCHPSVKITSAVGKAEPYPQISVVVNSQTKGSKVVVYTIVQRQKPQLTAVGGSISQNICSKTKGNHPNGVDYLLGVGPGGAPALPLNVGELNSFSPPAQSTSFVTLMPGKICQSAMMTAAEGNQLFDFEINPVDPTPLGGTIKDFSYSVSFANGGTAPIKTDGECSGFNPFQVSVIEQNGKTFARVSFKNAGFSPTGHFALPKGNLNAPLGCWNITGGSAAWIVLKLQATNLKGQGDASNVATLQTLETQVGSFAPNQ